MPSTTSDPLLDPLNDAQRAAVRKIDGPLLVVAGPGSGKTRVITHRIAYMVRQGIDVRSILAITFTNKAAGEMRERVEQLLGFRSPWISTFHSFAARLLRRHIYRLEPFDTSFSIYDADDSLSLIKSCIQELDIATGLVTPRQALAAISQLKNRGVEDPESLPFQSDTRERYIRQIFVRYARALQSRNALDFDDLLLFLERLLATQADLRERYRDQFRYVLVDEYQDTNQVQYRISRLLSEGHRNLCVTGDPDQSIYSWRGADIENILRFENDFAGATLIKLEQNYRSTGAILRVANRLIENNEERKDKALWTENPEGPPVEIRSFPSSESEAVAVARLIQELRRSGETAPAAVFYRINALSRELETALVHHGIPYAIVGAVEFYQRKEIKDILAYLKLTVNPRDTEALRRVVNVPPRRVGAATFKRLLAVAREEGRSPLEVVLSAELRPRVGRGASGRGLADFALLVEQFRVAPRSPVGELVRTVIEATDYTSYVAQFDPESAEDRVANVHELVNAAAAYDRRNEDGNLEGFLEQVALVSAVDTWKRDEADVHLMTFHAAKGLEFPVVVIAAAEEGLLPLLRADPDSYVDLEEERRLFYVGITRARRRLVITHARSRPRFGRPTPAIASSFLRELVELDGRPGSREELRASGLEVDAASERTLLRQGRRFWPEDDDADADADADADPDLGGRSVEEFSVDEWDDELDEDPYPPGSRVRHETYGEGTVLEASGLGRRRRLVVEFEDIGRKSLIAGYVKLRRIL